MTTSKAPKRSTMEVLEGQAKAEIEFLNTTLAAKLRWVESAVADIKREVAAGTHFPSTNFTKVAADVDMLYARLRYATDAQANLEVLKADK
jgi:hypothetical protein